MNIVDIWGGHKMVDTAPSPSIIITKQDLINADFDIYCCKKYE